MTSSDLQSRTDRSHATRELILTTAERLFAEYGVAAVSSRQICEAAGQGNNTAVGYHFGTKTDLVRAIINRHAGRIDELREQMVAGIDDRADIRAWVACLVHSSTDHLAELGNPTWYARFKAQLLTDPALREIAADITLSSPTVLKILDGLADVLSDLPLPVRLERGDMTSRLVVQMCAEFERGLAAGTPMPRQTWPDLATGLVDAIVGIWEAPVTP
jgi:AcrR family transcriptional regulator